ncbi:MAG: hypothetical protein HQM08_16785 [Candidatus Riflebacteria bacterium]|nr:hypothetical protein [Candidatus Riflebacteria bacterium]
MVFQMVLDTEKKKREKTTLLINKTSLQYNYFRNFKIFIKKPNLIGALLLFIFSSFIILESGYAVELDQVYKLSGSFKTISKPGLKIYYPATCEPVIGEIASNFAKIREEVGKAFNRWPNDLPVSVILTDFDDRDSGTVDTTFDSINIALFEETDSLSTRSFTLEQKFALRLANIMVLRTLGPARRAFKRRVGLLTTPVWLLQGLAMHKAFPMDTLPRTQIIQMARSGKIYSLEELDTINDQTEFEKDRMCFQARHMIDFWCEKAGENAATDFLCALEKNPIEFSQIFQNSFKMTFKQALSEYNEYLNNLAHQKDESSFSNPDIYKIKNEGTYCQGFQELPDGTEVYVSSRRYFQEVYDLFIDQHRKKQKPILRNVHPRFFFDQESGTLYIGRYFVNLKREKRLYLWAVPVSGESYRAYSEPGSYKPFAAKDGRLYFLNVQSGKVKIVSISLDKSGKGANDELLFPNGVLPLDVTMDSNGRFLVLIHKNGEFLLLRFDRSFLNKDPDLIFRSKREIRNLQFFDGKIWFSASDEAKAQIPQIFTLETIGNKTVLKCLSNLIGGVWDFSKTDKDFVVSTIKDSGFKLARCSINVFSSEENSNLPTGSGKIASTESKPKNNLVKEELSEVKNEENLSKVSTASFSTDANLSPNSKNSQIPLLTQQFLKYHFSETPDGNSNPYSPEWRKSYWLPRVSRDEQGAVFGVYSYQSDRLDRNSLIFSPTYGFKSRNWGYLADWMKRFDLFQTGVTIQDKDVQKSYHSNTYYERAKTLDIHASYPFTLSSLFSFGVNLTNRQIAKYPDNSSDVPSIGNDNSLYFRFDKRAIRTQPFSDIFPRKGREVTAIIKKGMDFFNGEMVYDSYSLRWHEYIPLNDRTVLTLRGWAAEDKKNDEIKRPDDLSLGGSDFLRGYSSSVRYGDSLRAFSLALGKPLQIEWAAMQKWVHKEILVLEAFYEIGDVHSRERSFKYLQDEGIELKTKALLLRRIPFSFRIGTAWPTSGGPRHSYWLIDFSAVTGLIQ